MQQPHEPTMLSVNDTKFLDEAYARIAEGSIVEGMNDLVGTLYQYCSHWPLENWKHFCDVDCHQHPLHALLQQDPYTRRAYQKPRGYAGDAELIDYIYRVKEPDIGTTPMGRDIFDYCMSRSTCESVRFRAAHLAESIDQVAKAVESPRVLSVACGHLREAALSKAIQEARVQSVTAIDQDIDSLTIVERSYFDFPVQAVCVSVKDIIVGRFNHHTYDFIYAAGLYDYLAASVAIALTHRLFQRLNPGGRLLVANFTPSTEERGYMDAFMDWTLIYRTEDEVDAFAERIDTSQIASKRLYPDPYNNVIYLEIVKH